MKPHRLEPWQIAQRQSLPLEAKIRMTRLRIRRWYEHYQGLVYVSFSGGVDSTVLLHVAREMYPKMPAVFFNTGLEFPEICEFVKTFDNVEWIRPKMTFKQVIEHYGYPIISKEQSHFLQQIRDTKSERCRNLRLYGTEQGNFKLSLKWRYLLDAPFKIDYRCCEVMKKRPAYAYGKQTGRVPIIGTMAGDSKIRLQVYSREGCNSFDSNHPASKPMSFWSRDDVKQYLSDNRLPYCSVYDMGYDHTGCIFCLFGLHMEKGENRFDLLKRTHPKLYDYCMNQLDLKTVLEWYPERIK